MRSPISSTPRWLAADTLSAGGALAFMASFLPLGQTRYPAVADEPATTLVEIPARTLASIMGVQANHLYVVSPDVCLLFVGVWGAPLLLVVIGLSLLVRRQPLRARVWVSGLLPILLGAGITVLYCAIYLLFPHGEVIQPKATLAYGPAVALSGYLIALASVIRLALQPTSRNTA
jgi:hypothetical protein